MAEKQTTSTNPESTVINGKLKTTFRRVEGCKKLDRQIAHYNMEKAGFTQINKDKGNGSVFSKLWKSYID